MRQRQRKLKYWRRWTISSDDKGRRHRHTTRPDHSQALDTLVTNHIIHSQHMHASIYMGLH
jgi:hypothetical protein